MKPSGFVLGLAAFVFVAGAFPGHAADGFDQKLSKDKQVVHVLNRLTFGPRPGDVDDVRRMGIEKWIRSQLSPDQLPESQTLDARLKPVGSLQLATWQIYEKYQQAQPLVITPSPAQLVPADQLRKLMSGTIDERRAVIASLTGDTRIQVLGVLTPQTFEGLPDVQAEQVKARQAVQAELQKKRRELNPPLNELLSPEQLQAVQRGTSDEKAALLKALDPDKRRQVLRGPQIQPQSLPEPFRREALAARNPQQLVTDELIEGKLYRALYSNRQLEEVLVDFWLNHFNVFNGKGQVRMLLTSYERDAIRPHVFGRFRDLLLATARHPAMLFYLDNWQSQSPRDDIQAPVFNGVQRRPGLNENYGRELMELHTLGVDGGYTQDDVIAVARAFTGWTIHEPGRYGEYYFNLPWHDRREKVVLGQTLPAGGGEQDGLRVIDILARHPSTAKFISRKLAQRFVADEPPQSLVKRMAETFTKTDGDLRAVVETMVMSPEFISEGAWQAKMKSPLEMVVSSLRALNADVTETTAVAQRIAALGQPLYGKQEPTGYPNTREPWSSSASLLGRINFATDVVNGQIQGVKVDVGHLGSKNVESVVAGLLGIAPPPQTRTAIETALQGKQPTPVVLATVVLASPEFQKR
jgi:uncharacterized protein (DUF1800 family)